MTDDLPRGYRLATPSLSLSLRLSICPLPLFLGVSGPAPSLAFACTPASFKWHRLSRIEKGIKNGRGLMRKTMPLQTIPLPICLGYNNLSHPHRGGPPPPSASSSFQFTCASSDRLTKRFLDHPFGYEVSFFSMFLITAGQI